MSSQVDEDLKMNPSGFANSFPRSMKQEDFLFQQQQQQQHPQNMFTNEDLAQLYRSQQGDEAEHGEHPGLPSFSHPFASNQDNSINNNAGGLSEMSNYLLYNGSNAASSNPNMNAFRNFGHTNAPAQPSLPPLQQGFPSHNSTKSLQHALSNSSSSSSGSFSNSGKSVFNDTTTTTSSSSKSRNAIACKRFREKRKRETETLKRRNEELEQERDALLEKVRALKMRVQELRGDGTVDLATENELYKAETGRYNHFVSCVTGSSAKPISPARGERAQTFRQGIDSSVAQALGLAYMSSSAQNNGLSWRVGQDIKVASFAIASKYEILPSGSTSDNATRLNMRLELRDMPVEYNDMGSRLSALLSDPAYVARAHCSTDDLVVDDITPNDVDDLLDLSTSGEKIRFLRQRSGSDVELINTAVSKVVDIFPRAISPSSNADEQPCKAYVSVRSATTTDMLKHAQLDPELSSPGSNDSEGRRARLEAPLLIGSIVWPSSTKGTNFSNVVVVMSYPVGDRAFQGFRGNSLPKVDADGNYNIDFVTNIQAHMTHGLLSKAAPSGVNSASNASSPQSVSSSAASTAAAEAAATQRHRSGAKAPDTSATDEVADTAAAAATLAQHQRQNQFNNFMRQQQQQQQPQHPQPQTSFQNSLWPYSSTQQPSYLAHPNSQALEMYAAAAGQHQASLSLLSSAPSLFSGTDPSQSLSGSGAYPQSAIGGMMNSANMGMNRNSSSVRNDSSEMPINLEDRMLNNDRFNFNNSGR